MKNRLIVGFLYATLCGLLATALAGCGSLDRKPETPEEALYVSASYLEALVLSVNDAYATRTITKAQQMESLEGLQHAKEVLTLATDAYVAGRYDEATDRLAYVEGILRSVALVLANVQQRVSQ